MLPLVRDSARVSVVITVYYYHVKVVTIYDIIIFRDENIPILLRVTQHEDVIIRDINTSLLGRITFTITNRNPTK